jgi:hypothetical protein
VKVSIINNYNLFDVGRPSRDGFSESSEDFGAVGAAGTYKEITAYPVI